MSRIKIEDLPAGHNLTPQEELEILGAGQRSFRPMIESLEGREMMDAGFGQSLQLPIPRPVAHGTEPAGQVQVLYTPAPGAVLEQANAAGRHRVPESAAQSQYSVSVEGDAGHIQDVAKAFLNERIIEGSVFKNRWHLQEGAVLKGAKIDGDRITITFDVGFGLDSAARSRCNVHLTFQGKNTGGIKEYDLAGASLEHWKGWASESSFGDVATTLFRNRIGKIICQRFDENAFANNIIRQAEMLLGGRPGDYHKNFIERHDGGIRIYIYTDNKEFSPLIDGQRSNLGRSERGKGELWLTFKYDDAQLAKGTVRLHELRHGFWYRDQSTAFYDKKWFNDSGAHDEMRAFDWRVTNTGQAPISVLERVGTDVGLSTLEWFRRTQASGKFGNVDGALVGLHSCTEGVKVDLHVWRSEDLGGKFGQGRIAIQITLTLKYEGVVNGQHQFKLVGLDHSTLGAGYVDLSMFGIDAGATLARYAQCRV